MVSFWLRSASDDWLSDPSDENQLKCEKSPPPPPSHQKWNACFLDYAQLLMIGCAIWVTKVDWNVEKGPLSHQKMKYSFLCYVQLLMISQLSEWWELIKMQNNEIVVWVFCMPPSPNGKVGIWVTEKFRFFRLMFNKFQPKDNSVQSLLHLLAMQLICDGQCTNWFTLHFYNL